MHCTLARPVLALALFLRVFAFVLAPVLIARPPVPLLDPMLWAPLFAPVLAFVLCFFFLAPVIALRLPALLPAPQLEHLFVALLLASYTVPVLLAPYPALVPEFVLFATTAGTCTGTYVDCTLACPVLVTRLLVTPACT